MTQIQRIDADLLRFLSAMIRARPCHPRSIDTSFAANVNALIPYTQMKTELYSAADFEHYRD